MEGEGVFSSGLADCQVSSKHLEKQLNAQLDIGVWSLGENTELEVEIWELSIQRLKVEDMAEGEISQEKYVKG